jgi:exodeoxyribonuclease-3
MRFISWNVNGLRAARAKGFDEIFLALSPDFFCLQETKLQQGQIDISFDGYESYWCYAEKKGYSGTAVFTKHTPLSVSYNIGVEEHGREGRAVTLEYEDFFLVCVYTPNAQDGLRRLNYRMQWENDFRDYLLMLDRTKPVVVCGDMNVAHQEIDLKNPATNHQNAGFSDEERAKFTELLNSGWIDTFRYLYPDRRDAYSWWSYRFRSRERNAGWRIDYFLMRKEDAPFLKEHTIYSNVYGSDHCPVGIVTEGL